MSENKELIDTKEDSKKSKTFTEPKKRRKIKRTKGKSKHYFDQSAQNGVESYISNLIGSTKYPFIGTIEEHFNGKFTQDSGLEGNFSGTMNAFFNGYINEGPFDGYFNKPYNGYFSGTFKGPIPAGLSVLNGMFSGTMEGSFEQGACHDIYANEIKKSFEALVNGLIHTYKINFYGEDVYHVTHEAVTFLYETLHKYNKDKSKAFSYFNVCAKHWLFQKSEYLKKNRSRQADISDINVLSQINEWDKPSYSQNMEDIYESEQFLILLHEKIDEWIAMPGLHEDEHRLLETVKVLFDKAGDFENINRKIIYQIIREIGNFSPSDVTKRLRSVRDKYKKFKNEYDNGNI